MAVAAVVVFGFLISTLTLPYRMHAASALDPAQQRAAMAGPYTIAASLILGATFIVGIFYCLDALYGERRDRSILFWKSLPVSDLTTVLSKAIVPLMVIPPLAFAFALVTQTGMLLIVAVALPAHGISIAPLWDGLVWGQMVLVMLYKIVVHVLWYAPLYGWLLLVSAWCQRGPILWAVLPPAVCYAFERIAFDTSYVIDLLRYRFTGAATEAFVTWVLGVT